MQRKQLWMPVVSISIAILFALPLQSLAESNNNAPQKKLSKEELAQLLAPIALYPDELVSQILMASTYPLEVVQADRWVKKNKKIKGDALAKALEKENWDPSVKSLVGFPSILAAMSEKLDLTTKVGDAFLSQQKDVMDTIQMLRKKAYDAGNLKTSKEQKVIVEKEVIVIKQADPEVIYVPSYSPTVVYGAWMYPAYPPYYYYPPPPPAYPAYHFAAGVAIGVAWGYAWGNCNWHGGHVEQNINQNINVNRNIDRSKYQNRVNPNDRQWQHNPEHRRGVAYKDGATAKRYGQSPARSMEGRRESRGYGSTGSGRGDRPSAGTMDRGGAGGGAAKRDKIGSAGGSKGDRPSAGTMDRGGRGSRDSAFSRSGESGKQARAASDRGASSRQSSVSSGSFGGGGSRGGRGSSGGASRGGGGRGGGRR
ncbi:MAG: DUF3300 domain-containing protein [Smithella sp.]